MLVRVFGDFLEDLAIAVRRGDVALHRSGIVGAFILQFIERFLTSVGVHALNGSAFIQKYAVHAHVRLDGHRFVINEEAVEDGLLHGVTKNRRTKQRRGVRRGRGGETDFDGVEVIYCGAPDAHFLRRVSAMAFVRDDDVKSLASGPGQGGQIPCGTPRHWPWPTSLTFDGQDG